MLAVPENIPLTLAGADRSAKSGLKPLMVVTGVIGDDVHDDLYIQCLLGCRHLVEIGEGAYPGIHVPVVRNVV